MCASFLLCLGIPSLANLIALCHTQFFYLVYINPISNYKIPLMFPLHWNLTHKQAMIEWKNLLCTFDSLNCGTLLIYLEFGSKIVRWFSHFMFNVVCFAFHWLRFSLTLSVFMRFRIESCIRNTEFIIQKGHCIHFWKPLQYGNFWSWFEFPEIAPQH